MRRLALVRSALAAAVFVCAASVHAQGPAPAPAEPVSLVFANDLGEGRFRTALAGALAEQLAAGRRSPGLMDAESVAVVTVRSLSEQAPGNAPATLEALVAVSLLDAGTGRVRVTRIVRSAYPAAASDAVERLGELAGRRLARALCDSSACGVSLRPAATPSRRIIKESDW